MFSKKVVLISIFFIILMNLATAQYYYQDAGYSLFPFGGLDDVFLVYESYSSLIDFIIFLLIFLGVTQAIFGQGNFKDQSKIISIGLSLALSFGLVFWERRVGITLLSFGPFALLILFILFMYLIFSLMKHLGNDWWVAGAWVYVIGFGAITFISPELYNWPQLEKIFPFLYLLFWGCIFIGLIGLFAQKPKQGGTP